MPDELTMKRRQFIQFVSRGLIAAGYVGAFGLPTGVTAGTAGYEHAQITQLIHEHYMRDANGKWYRSAYPIGDKPTWFEVNVEVEYPDVTGYTFPADDSQQRFTRIVERVIDA